MRKYKVKEHWRSYPVLGKVKAYVAIDKYGYMQPILAKSIYHACELYESQGRDVTVTIRPMKPDDLTIMCREVICG